MKRILFALVILSMFLKACGQGPSSLPKEKDILSDKIKKSVSRININGKTIASRFLTPEKYKRTTADSASFTTYLRNLHLKPHGSKVIYYNGATKLNGNVYDAVVDLPIGKLDLHQCADAVIRLKAEYLYQQKRYDDIHFNFTNGFRADYSTWRKGKRIVVNGNHVYWNQKARPSDSYKDFWNYLERVFSYAGTASLSKELKSIPIEALQIGDVFIQGGFPGHAVIVVDMAIHETTDEKIFLLAQSYMPAQEIQLLKNRNDPDLSPWYTAKNKNELKTPEWIFKMTDLKRFSE